MSTFKARFWGVRGSIPAPGPLTVKYGGNTAALEITAGDRRLAIDAGTGIRALGDDLLAHGVSELDLFLSHFHWDHIQGLPFFAPLYRDGFELRIHSPLPAEEAREILLRQMSPPTFPVSLADAPARVIYHQLPEAGTFEPVEGIRLTTAPLFHPGGCLGFRFETAGGTFAHVSDMEHRNDGSLCPHAIELMRNADFATYDATYTPAEYEGTDGHVSHRGWGHSTWVEAIRYAESAGVGGLILFHHEPSRTDAELDDIEAEARCRHARLWVARESMVIDVKAGTVANSTPS